MGVTPEIGTSRSGNLLLQALIKATSYFDLSKKSLETPPLILFCLINKTLKHHLLF
jgi:hypothetical protein